MFYDKGQLTFASPLPTVRPSFLALVKPFGILVWIMIVIEVIIMSAIFYAISNIEVFHQAEVLRFLLNFSLLQGSVVGFNFDEWSKISEALWYCFGTMIGEAITRDRRSAKALALRY